MVETAISEVVEVFAEDVLDAFWVHCHVEGFGEDEKAAMFEVFGFQ